MSSSFLPKKRRDRALLVVGTTLTTAALLVACGSDSDDGGGTTDGAVDAHTDGPVGNLAVPDTGDAGADTVFNPDGPVGNTALPADTGIADTDAGSDATATDGTSDADGG